MSGANARFLAAASPEAQAIEDATAAYKALAIFCVIALAISLAAGAVTYVRLQQRGRARRNPHGDLLNGDVEKDGSSHDREALNGTSGVGLLNGERLAAVEAKVLAGPQSALLYGKLAELLHEEISRGLQRAGVSERLDKLERKDDSPSNADYLGMADRLDRLEGKVQGGSFAEVPLPPATFAATAPAVAPPPLSPIGATPPCLGGSPESGAAARGEALRASASPSALRARTSLCTSTREADTSIDADLLEEEDEYGVTRTLRRKSPRYGNMRLSLDDMQRKLGRIDGHTSELHRQLRSCQKDIWIQTLEEKHSRRRLCALLCNPDFAPQISWSQAEEIRSMEGKLQELSGLLADARQQEAQWSLIAGRQRAFYAQNHSDRPPADGAAALLKKHPAGIVFCRPLAQRLLPEEEEDMLDLHNEEGLDESYLDADGL
eukprot:TRINITY_DN90369_c0_g1_i1.p1 TRINITY_DN90369_c0_g1~~TRINITY_DN90369_c0_g1_i1.p1  ORF type:complete len:435 (+),score=115.33 TRINITY_DN90369_c0_g1_i1:106-1410(+)